MRLIGRDTSAAGPPNYDGAPTMDGRRWFVDPDEIGAVIVDEITGNVAIFLKGHREPIPVCDPADKVLPAMAEARYCRFCRQELASRPTNVNPWKGPMLSLDQLRRLRDRLDRAIEALTGKRRRGAWRGSPCPLCGLRRGLCADGP